MRIQVLPTLWENKNYLWYWPAISVFGTTDEDVHVHIRFTGRVPGEERYLCEFQFSGVLEYRWLEFNTEYPYFDSISEAWLEALESGVVGGFRPVEIEGSPYIENMLSKGPRRNNFGKRAGGILEESIRHFVLPFDDYGTFDIIALDYRFVVIEQVDREGERERD